MGGCSADLLPNRLVGMILKCHLFHPFHEMQLQSLNIPDEPFITKGSVLQLFKVLGLRYLINFYPLIVNHIYNTLKANDS